MKQLFKRILSTLLALSIMLSLFAVHASAATVNESESNNDYASANSITLGNTIKGTISASKDVDYFKVQTSSDGKVSIVFKHPYADSAHGWTIRYYEYKDGKYTEFTNYNVRMSGGDTISLPSIGVAASVTYYIKIQGIYTYDNTLADKEYQLVTSFTSTNYYEKEVNDEYAKATPVSLGNTYGGNLNNANDNDYYKITSSTSGKVSIIFKYPYADSVHGWTIHYYEYKDGKYKELTNYTVRMNAGDTISLPSIDMVASVTYYVKIKGIYNYDDTSVGKEYTISFGGTGGGSGNNPTPVEPTDSGFFVNLAKLINEWANSDNILLRILGIILKVILPFAS